MLKQTRRLFRSQVIWGITLALLAPTLAQAQQTGLFPLSPIRRQRVPCAAEDPVYRRYRQDYYGYYPTCWRRFPPGWGCPSPEGPNMKKEYENIPPTPVPPYLLGRGDDSAEGDDAEQGDRDARPMKPDIPGVPSGGPLASWIPRVEAQSAEGRLSACRRTASGPRAGGCGRRSGSARGCPRPGTAPVTGPGVRAEQHNDPELRKRAVNTAPRPARRHHPTDSGARSGRTAGRKRRLRERRDGHANPDTAQAKPDRRLV